MLKWIASCEGTRTQFQARARQVDREGVSAMRNELSIVRCVHILFDQRTNLSSAVLACCSNAVVAQ